MAIVKTVTHGACKGYIHDDCIKSKEEQEKIVEEIRKELHFTTLRYHRLDDMIASVGIDSDKLCTYCWDGKE